MEEKLIKSNTSHTSTSSEENNSIETIEKKQADLLEQETSEEPEITREQLSISKRLLNWRTIVPLVIVVVALVIFARQANINPQKTWSAIRSANIIFYLAAFLIYYLSFPIRTIRWRLLLENVGYKKSNGIHLPKFLKLLEILYISWFANVIVPAKLGDLYRAYLLREETGLSATRTFGTVLAERLLDLIILLLLFITAIMISLHENLPTQLHVGLIFTLALVGAGIVGLFMLHMLRYRIAKLVPARFLDQYNHFQEGTLGSFRHIPTLTILTVCVWMCESLRFFFVALALNLIGGGFVHMLTAAIFIGLGEALLTAIPFTGGGVGLVEAGLIAMIALFNPTTLTTGKSIAAAAIVLDRSISLLSVLVLGFIVFMIAFGRQATKQQRFQQKSGAGERA